MHIILQILNLKKINLKEEVFLTVTSPNTNKNILSNWDKFNWTEKRYKFWLLLCVCFMRLHLNLYYKSLYWNGIHHIVRTLCIKRLLIITSIIIFQFILKNKKTLYIVKYNMQNLIVGRVDIGRLYIASLIFL